MLLIAVDKGKRKVTHPLFVYIKFPGKQIASRRNREQGDLFILKLEGKVQPQAYIATYLNLSDNTHFTQHVYLPIY